MGSPRSTLKTHSKPKARVPSRNAWISAYDGNEWEWAQMRCESRTNCLKPRNRILRHFQKRKRPFNWEESFHGNGNENVSNFPIGKQIYIWAPLTPPPPDAIRFSGTFRNVKMKMGINKLLCVLCLLCSVNVYAIYAQEKPINSIHRVAAIAQRIKRWIIISHYTTHSFGICVDRT